MLIKNLMVIPVVTVTFFLFGWWIYFAFINGPFINGGVGFGYWPRASTPGRPDGAEHGRPHHRRLLGGVPVVLVDGGLHHLGRDHGTHQDGRLPDHGRGDRLGLLDHRRGLGLGPNGWMVQLMGYHDAYASGVIHAIAGGAALGVLVVLGPRIGKFGPNGEIRTIRPHNVWMACVGLLLVYTGFWGFYAACNIPVLNVGTEAEPFFSATNIYLMPTTLSGITFNFLMSLSGGLMAGYILEGDPYWTLSCGLTGIIAASAGNDLYHPLQATFVGVAGATIAYKGHYYVERRFKIDDGVGAVAVHGYSGFFGVVIAGFLLWGYPAAAPVVGSARPGSA